MSIRGIGTGRIEPGGPEEVLPGTPAAPAASEAGGALALGAKGDAVRALQEALRKLEIGSPKDPVDGVFGRATERAVAQFQRKVDLPPSGALDAATRAKLEAILSVVAPSKPLAAPAAEWAPRGAARMLFPAMGGIAGKDEEFAALAKFVGKAADVTVAVVDSGVDFAHPVLEDNRFRNPGEVPGDQVDNDKDGLVDDLDGWNFADDVARQTVDLAANPGEGHGTAVAGVAAYGTDKIKIMGLRTAGATDAGGKTDDFKAIEYARAHGARVVNLSFGGTDPAMAHWLRLAIDRNPDLLFVDAAGNEGADIEKAPMFPASFEHEHLLVVANAANPEPDAPRHFSSNWGVKSVDLAAPGTEFLTTAQSDDPAAQVGPDGARYVVDTGTSIAAPFVSNVAAKLFSLCPSLTALEAKKIILETVDADRNFQGKVATGGIINSLRAYQCAAVLAKAKRPADIDKVIAKLPGGVPEAERAQLKRVAEEVLADRARRG